MKAPRKVSSPGSITNSIDGSFLLLVPSGSFLAGDASERGGNGPFKITLPAFYLGMYAVTNAQFARFLTARQPSQGELEKWIHLQALNSFKRWDNLIRLNGSVYEPYENVADHPVRQVTWFGADAYCRWAGLRLPTELEFEKGARGVDGRTFPWGNEWDSNKCRNFDSRGEETTSRVGDYPAGRSPWGHHQMSGNVWEWCEDFFEEKAYSRYRHGDLTIPGRGPHRVIRGGGWRNSGPVSFQCTPSGSAGCSPDDFSDRLGFRVAKSL